jgi:hypothetical protein
MYFTSKIQDDETLALQVHQLVNNTAGATSNPAMARTATLLEDYFER